MNCFVRSIVTWPVVPPGRPDPHRSKMIMSMHLYLSLMLRPSWPLQPWNIVKNFNAFSEGGGGTLVGSANGVGNPGAPNSSFPW